MSKFWDFLLMPLGWVLEKLTLLFGGNFALAIFFFTLILNVILIPLSMKTQKSSAAQARVKPKLDALKKKYGDDRQRYSMEMQKLYQQENVSMSGGCLPLLIRFPIMIGIYNVVLSPLKYIAGVSTETIEAAGKAVEAKFGAVGNNYLLQPAIINRIQNGELTGFDEIANKIKNLDFSFFGIDLTSKPTFNIDIIHHFEWNWMIPLLAFAAAMISSIISIMVQKKVNPDAPNMKGMMLTMPLISLFLGFTVSAAAGFYWACSSLIAGGIQAFLQVAYGPGKIIAADQLKQTHKRVLDENKLAAAAKTKKAEN